MTNPESRIYQVLYGLTQRLAATFLAPVIDGLIDFSIKRSAERLNLMDYTNVLAGRGVKTLSEALVGPVNSFVNGLRNNL